MRIIHEIDPQREGADHKLRAKLNKAARKMRDDNALKPPPAGPITPSQPLLADDVATKAQESVSMNA